jgi:aryl-alcohol dehydrogenase-like predicted oxidoreductase
LNRDYLRAGQPGAGNAYIGPKRCFNRETGGAMNLALLGKSGLQVSRIGLGLAALGRPGYINLGHSEDLGHDYDPARMEAHCHAVLDAAWAAGIRYFDVARSYGNGEAYLGSWLKSRHIDPNVATIASKWGYTYTADWKVDIDRHEVKEHSLAVLKRQYAESRALLGNYLNIYQIHSATLESGVLENQPILDELTRLRATGLKMGLTLSGPRQTETLARAIKLGIFDCVQATWNLLESSVGGAARRAHDAGMGVIVKEALANGRLSPRNSDPKFAHRRKVLEDNARRLNCTLDALAIAAVLDQSWCHVVLSGAAQIEHVRSNVAAAEVRLDNAARKQLSRLAETPEDFWARRGRLAWN